jgi:hypothetical protein
MGFDAVTPQKRLREIHPLGVGKALVFRRMLLPAEEGMTWWKHSSSAKEAKATSARHPGRER